MIKNPIHIHLIEYQELTVRCKKSTNFGGDRSTIRSKTGVDLRQARVCKRRRQGRNLRLNVFLVSKSERRRPVHCAGADRNTNAETYVVLWHLGLYLLLALNMLVEPFQNDLEHFLAHGIIE